MTSKLLSMMLLYFFIISTSVKQPIKGLGVSNTIRGAVASWAKTLSFELGEFGITVNKYSTK